MKLLQRMLDDVKQGENIDLYLTILAAIGIPILNILGFAPANLIGPLTLAVLGLLAFSSLNNRHRNEELLRKMTQSSSNLFLEEFPASFENHIKSSRDLVLVGVALTRLLSKYYSVLEQKIQRGDKVRILLVHPEGASLEMAVSRALWESDIETLRSRIQSSLDAVCYLKRIAPSQVGIRTIKNPLSYSATLVDHGSPDSRGIIYIENYPYKSPKPFTPKHIFYESDSEWYSFFANETLRLWENGVEWQCKVDAIISPSQEAKSA